MREAHHERTIRRSVRIAEGAKTPHLTRRFYSTERSELTQKLSIVNCPFNGRAAPVIPITHY
jgi:hypothetical protein